ncbi:MAG: hypothetical protein WKG07_44370 [Hymenobacter sp.]
MPGAELVRLLRQPRHLGPAAAAGAPTGGGRRPQRRGAGPGHAAPRRAGNGGAPRRPALEKEDPSISAVLLDRLRAEGLTIHLETEVTAFLSAHAVQVQPAAGPETTVEFDAVYVAIGRASGL